MRPFEADRRVYLVFGADSLNEDAADALLKDLEEPPPYAVVVLVAERLGPLPETIRSRCQLVPFRRLSEPAVRQAIQEHAPDLGEEEVTTLARVAGGRLGRALQLLDPGRSPSARGADRRRARGLHRARVRARRRRRGAPRRHRRARDRGEGDRRGAGRDARADRARGRAARPPRAARRRARGAARAARGARVVVPRPRRRRRRRRGCGRPRRPPRGAAGGRDARADARRRGSVRARPGGLARGGGAAGLDAARARGAADPPPRRARRDCRIGVGTWSVRRCGCRALGLANRRRGEPLDRAGSMGALAALFLAVIAVAGLRRARRSRRSPY